MVPAERNLAPVPPFPGQEPQRRRWYMRRISPFTLAAALAAALTGCGLGHSSDSGEGSGSSMPVSNAVYERALASWVNHPEEDLIGSWGVPERSQRLTDGGQALEYRRLDASGRVLCTTVFTSDVYGQIRTWVYRGSQCHTPHLGDYGNPS